jgi:hypothetical protein
VTPSRDPAIRPVAQQRLSGSTTIRAGFGPKNLIDGGLFDPRPGRLVEDLEQGPGMPAGLEGGPPQRRHARDRDRSGHDAQEPAGDGKANPLGLGDTGELVLLVAADLRCVLQPLAEGPILGVAVGEPSSEFVDPSLGRSAVDGVDDLLRLTVERLAGLVASFGHLGDVAVSAAQDGEGAGDTPGDRGHGELAPSRPVEGSRPRLHTPRRELSTDHTGTQAVLR